MYSYEGTKYPRAVFPPAAPVEHRGATFMSEASLKEYLSQGEKKGSDRPPYKEAQEANSAGLSTAQRKV